MSFEDAIAFDLREYFPYVAVLYVPLYSLYSPFLEDDVLRLCLAKVEVNQPLKTGGSRLLIYCLLINRIIFPRLTLSTNFIIASCLNMNKEIVSELRG